MNAPAKPNEIDPLLHPAQVAKLLGVSHSWLAKSRLNGTGPRFIERVDLVTLAESKLTPHDNRALAEMEMGYFKGVQNPYSQQIPDGRERTLQVVEFLQQHNIFPHPPALLYHLNGTIEIVDGNHRILAFILAMKMHPPAASPIQDVWIGRSPRAP
jgi:hypothetical protein